MTPTNTEALAALSCAEAAKLLADELEQQYDSGDYEPRLDQLRNAVVLLRALRRQSEEVAAERDKFASESAQHFIRGREWAERAGQMEAERDALQADYSRLMEKHNNLHLSALKFKAERDALRAALVRARGDINWMLNNGQFLNPEVFDYLDAAMKGTQ